MSRYFHQKGIDRVGSKYDLVVVAARRARDLKNTTGTKTPIVQALTDLNEGTIDKNYAVDRMVEDIKEWQAQSQQDEL